jgi:hypothetical protein
MVSASLGWRRKALGCSPPACKLVRAFLAVTSGSLL